MRTYNTGTADIYVGNARETLSGNITVMVREAPPIFFWSQKAQYGFLSNFALSPIYLGGTSYPTVEHYYQSQKTTSLDEWHAIANAKTPGDSKKLGRKATMRPDWEEVKYGVMLRALMAKFTQHDGLAEKLLATEDAFIYEDSPYDLIWGTGGLGKTTPGTNLLGKALMEIRDVLRTVDKMNV